MRRVTLLLDGSESMNRNDDLKPTRILAMKPILDLFLRTFFESNPLALLSLIVMHDGIAKRICRATNDSRALAEAIDRKYILTRGKGSMSLENGLKTALLDLAPESHVDTTHGRRSTSSSSSSAALQKEILLISGAVTVIDAGDIYKTVSVLSELHVTCNIISLSGAPQVLSETASRTGGQLMSPLSPDHLFQLLNRISASPFLTGSVVGHHGGGQHLMSSRAAVCLRGGGASSSSSSCPICAHVNQQQHRTSCELCGQLLVNEVDALSARRVKMVVASSEQPQNTTSTTTTPLQCPSCGVHVRKVWTIARCRCQMCDSCCDASKVLQGCAVCGA